MSIEETDRESAAVAKNPDGRVSLAQIEAAIIHRLDFRLTDLTVLLRSQAERPHNTSLLTKGDTGGFAIDAFDAKARAMSVCALALRNGFIVIGKSAPADPENFNEELGKKFAYEDAIRQLWPLMAFALKDRLAG